MSQIPKFEETEEIIDVPKFDETEAIEVSKPEPIQEEVPVKKAPVRKDKLEILKAGLAGVATGATLGWFDEALAGANAALDVAIDTVMRPFTPEEQAKFIEKPEFKKVYREEQTRIRNEIKRLEKEPNV
jgi:hypothetical protein